MGEKEYSVSEAVRLVGVESHVLRYWEEELHVPVGRSAQGHRMYSEHDIELFRRTKELKDCGIQLKAIRLLFEGEGRLRDQRDGSEAEEGQEISRIARNLRELDSSSEEPERPAYEIIPDEKKENMRRFEAILKRLIAEVVEEQNEKLEKVLCETIQEEAANLFELYQSALEEAAAEREAQKKHWIRAFLERCFGKKRP